MFEPLIVENDILVKPEPQLGWTAQGAIFSPCMHFRYALWRQWSPDLPTIAFCMLNPSIADAFILDPTVTRCVNYAKEWGYGELIVLNIFAFRSTDPAALYDFINPIGCNNDFYISQVYNKVDKVIMGFGNHGELIGRGREVLARIRSKAYYLKLNKSGLPSHPLYLKADLGPRKFENAPSTKVS